MRHAPHPPGLRGLSILNIFYFFQCQAPGDGILFLESDTICRFSLLTGKSQGVYNYYLAIAFLC